MIIQGTTPYLLITIEGYDLSSAEAMVVTIMDDKQNKYSFDQGRITVAYGEDDEASVLALHLTQAETLALKGAMGVVDLRWRDTNGEAYATEKKRINLDYCLYKGVI